MIREGASWGFSHQGHEVAVRTVPSWTGTGQPDPARWAYWGYGQCETELQTGLGPERSQ